MGMNGINFDARNTRLNAYRKYLQNANKSGIENKPILLQLSQYKKDSDVKPPIWNISDYKLDQEYYQKAISKKPKNISSKISKFFKGKGGKFALVGAALTAALVIGRGIGKMIFNTIHDDKPEQPEAAIVPPTESNEPTAQVVPNDSVPTLPNDTVPALPNNSVPVTPNDSTVVVPPLNNEETAEETVPATAEETAKDDADKTKKAVNDDAKIAVDESKDATEKVADNDSEEAVTEEEIEETAKDDVEVAANETKDAVSDNATENEGTQKPIGLSKGDGLTVAQLKGEIHENIVQNRYLRREIRRNKKYARRIGVPNEARPSDEAMQEKINENKNETRLYRQQIKEIRRVERQERRLERQAHRDIRKLKKKADRDAEKLLTAAQQARKSGLEINETKLENDVENIHSSVKTQTDKIYEQTEKSIEQGRLALKA